MKADITATPLNNGGFTRPLSFANGFKIQTITPILWDLAVIATTYLSKNDQKQMSQSKFWLTFEELDDSFAREVMSDKYSRVQKAMEALQILYPVGGRNIYAGFVREDAGFDLIRSLQPQQMECTYLGRFLTLDEEEFESTFDSIYQGICRAEEKRILRLQNPVTLLILGFQAHHPHMSTMFWVMALDMLFMAGGKTPFCERIQSFLGPETLLIPKLTYFKQHPNVKVSDVVEDAFDFRNAIAHGQAIPYRFYQPYELSDVSGERLSFELQYQDVIRECSLFMLVASLKKIMTSDLVEVVADDTEWRRQLKGNCKRLRT